MYHKDASWLCRSCRLPLHISKEKHALAPIRVTRIFGNNIAECVTTCCTITREGNVSYAQYIVAEDVWLTLNVGPA